MRIGIDDDHLTYLDAGVAAEQEGAAAVALHARTAAQHYSGYAVWPAITALKQAVTTIPVLGNGDIWSADDAVRMVAETGCDGVVVGRGCLGRPWLFADLAAAFEGSTLRVQPTLGEVADTMRRHAAYLVEFYDDENRGCRDIRKHIAWYLRDSLPEDDAPAPRWSTPLAALDRLLDGLDADAPWPGADARVARARWTPKRVALPDGWLDSPDLSPEQQALVAQAELDVRAAGDDHPDRAASGPAGAARDLLRVGGSSATGWPPTTRPRPSCGWVCARSTPSPGAHLGRGGAEALCYG
jgi:hypothetical protein